MILNVKVKPGAMEERVKKIDLTHFEVWVREAPEKGKANDAVIEALADFFDVPRARLRIKSGRTTRNKRIELL